MQLPLQSSPEASKHSTEVSSIISEILMFCLSVVTLCVSSIKNLSGLRPHHFNDSHPSSLSRSKPSFDAVAPVLLYSSNFELVEGSRRIKSLIIRAPLSILLS